MSDDHTHPEPVAYSYNVSTNGSVTGHSVTIAPHQLDSAITAFKNSPDAHPRRLTDTLRQAMLYGGDFGSIPESSAISGELQRFIDSHVAVMKTMGGVLEDFVARVHAAAELGYRTDPETRRQMAWARAHER